MATLTFSEIILDGVINKSSLSELHKYNEARRSLEHIAGHSYSAAFVYR